MFVCQILIESLCEPALPIFSSQDVDGLSGGDPVQPGGYGPANLVGVSHKLEEGLLGGIGRLVFVPKNAPADPIYQGRVPL